jgi:biopolymer transport protein ExbB/TolQ
MPQMQVIFTPVRVQHQGAHVDSAAVLERLRALVGPELSEGWTLADFVRVDGSALSWLATLQHSSENICRTVMERVAWNADPEFRLWQDESASQPPAEAPTEPAPPPPPLLLPLPGDVPAILTGSEANWQWSAALIGVLAGIAAALALGLLVPAPNVLRQIFNPYAPSIAVPAAILCLFFWGAALGLIRWRRLVALDELNSPDLLPAVIEGLSTHGVPGLNNALKDEFAEYSPLLRSVQAALEQWILRPSLQNANLAVKRQILSSQDETRRAGNQLRVFVWSTALLGLIGALLGLFLAVGGFEHALSIGMDNTSRFHDALGGLTGGLSFALLVTLEGLLAALILMLPASALRSREERLYADLELSLVEEFLPELQRAAPEQDPLAIERWKEAMAGATQKVLDSIETAGNSLLTSWDEKHQGYLADLDSVQQALDRTTLNIVKALESGTNAIGFQLAQTVTAQKTVLQQMLEEAKQGLQSHSAELKEATQTVVESLQQSTGEIGAHIKTVAEALDQSAADHRNLTQQAFALSSQALAGYPAEMTRFSAALSDLGKVTGMALQAQAVLQDSMTKLGDSRLANLMEELDSTLKDLKPAIANLSQPFVLQAVPVRNNQP